MFDWAKRLLGLEPPPERLAESRARERALNAVAEAHIAIKARYDNSLTTDENQRNWWGADPLSAKAANNWQVRRQLRNRTRYELSNNPYLWGVCTSYADDLIGTGPTLQCLLPSASDNRQIESGWQEYCQEIAWVEKVRTCVLAFVVDGEGILVQKTVAEQEHPVKLYPIDIEADQMTTPAPKDLEALWVDGLVLHPVTQRPVSYDILRHHPGDYFFPDLSPLKYDRIKAAYVTHLFPRFRPGQCRGIPIFTPALDLFAELRAFRKSVLGKAQLGAAITGVVETDAPADADGVITTSPFDKIPIDRGLLLALPHRGRMHQYEAGVSESYEVFQEKCLGEACRPLGYPLNLALGTSQKFNFSSSQLDIKNYRGSLGVRRDECNRVVLDAQFGAYLQEAALVRGFLPRGIRSIKDVPHEWHWPGFVSLDAVADATADHARLSNGTLTYQQFWAARGYDWRTMMAQQAAELQEIDKLHLTFGEPKTQAVAAPPAEEAAHAA